MGVRRVWAVLVGATIGVVLPFLAAVPATAAPPDGGIDAGRSCVMTLTGGMTGSFPCKTTFHPLVLEKDRMTGIAIDDVGMSIAVTVILIVPHEGKPFLYSGSATITDPGGVEWAVSPAPGSVRFVGVRGPSPRDGGVIEVHGTIEATLPCTNIARDYAPPDIQLKVTF